MQNPRLMGGVEAGDHLKDGVDGFGRTHRARSLIRSFNVPPANSSIAITGTPSISSAPRCRRCSGDARRRQAGLLSGTGCGPSKPVHVRSRP